MNKFNHSDFKNKVKELGINVYISSSSFEERCFIIPNLLTECTDFECVYFYNTNEEEIIVLNAEKLKLVNSCSSLVKLNSDEPISNYLAIDHCLNQLISKYNKPKILFDCTTFTHETLLILLKALEIRSNELGDISFSYVGADNYSFNSTCDEEKWLSKGIKIIRTVLGYSGLTDPIEKNHLMILFGFESERTKKIIEEYEYDIISLGFANIDESIQTNHYKINYERHKALLNEFPNAKEFTFSLIDAYQTKDNILSYLKDQGLTNVNTVIAPLNTKISTIGAGLAAIENQNIQIAYAKPNIYNVEGYSKPNNDIYLDTVKFNN